MSHTSSQPSTQPAADVIFDETKSVEPLAYLMPLSDRAIPIAITRDVFSLGRSEKNDFVVTAATMYCNYEAVSKFHCTIVAERDASGDSTEFFVVDKSSNGTFINSVRVACSRGHNSSHPKSIIGQGDIISLTSPNLKHFSFLPASVKDNMDYPGRVRQKYVMSRELGKGACGIVMLAIRRDDHSHVAVKIVDKSKVSMMSQTISDVTNEARVLRELSHPCIICMLDVIECDSTKLSKLYIVLEYASGGELFDLVIQKKRLNELEARVIMYQILLGVQYLHKQSICHRDLKPENILLTSQAPDTPESQRHLVRVKITDFGLSKFVDVHTQLKTFCGTPHYLAPEVLSARSLHDGHYTLLVDMWSVGVIFFILLAGQPPFHPDRRDKPLVRQVMDIDYDLEPSAVWLRTSPAAVHLVQHLMCSADQRLAASEAIGHGWIQSDLETVRAVERLIEEDRIVSLPPSELSPAQSPIDCLSEKRISDFDVVSLNVKRQA